jgi:hypothetical protein
MFENCTYIWEPKKIVQAIIGYMVVLCIVNHLVWRVKRNLGITRKNSTLLLVPLKTHISLTK